MPQHNEDCQMDTSSRHEWDVNQPRARHTSKEHTRTVVTASLGSTKSRSTRYQKSSSAPCVLARHISGLIRANVLRPLCREIVYAVTAPVHFHLPSSCVEKGSIQGKIIAGMHPERTRNVPRTYPLALSRPPPPLMDFSDGSFTKRTD